MLQRFLLIGVEPPRNVKVTRVIDVFVDQTEQAYRRLFTSDGWRLEVLVFWLDVNALCVDDGQLQPQCDYTHCGCKETDLQSSGARFAPRAFDYGKF